MHNKQPAFIKWRVVLSILSYYNSAGFIEYFSSIFWRKHYVISAILYRIWGFFYPDFALFNRIRFRFDLVVDLTHIRYGHFHNLAIIRHQPIDFFLHV